MLARIVPSFVLLSVVLLPVSVVAAEGDAAARKLGVTAARKVLEHYVGHWKGHACQTEPGGVQRRSSTESGGRFILGGNFVEMRSTDGERGSNLQIIGFDEHTDHFRLRAFSSKGVCFEASGRWSPESGTMAWSGTLHGDLRFAAEETHATGGITSAWRVSDKRGRPVVLGSSDDRRVAPTAPEKQLERMLHVVSDSLVPELKPLQAFLGPWSETLVVEVPGRPEIPGGGTYVATWVLGGAFQLWRGRRETGLGSEEYVWMFAFDKGREEHRAWWFSGSGAAVEYVGGRRSGSEVWRWRASGLAAEVEQTLTLKAATPTRVESALVTRRPDGKGITLRATARSDRSPAN